MAGLLKTLNAVANPKKRAEVKTAGLEHLNEKTALILFAVAESVLGEGFLKKAPKFIETVDDYLNYQRPAQREAFLTALLLAETRLFNFIVGGSPKPFSHQSLAERRQTLEQLRASKQQQGRNIYAAFVNVSASTFYASDLTWPDIGYTGVSVERPEILNRDPPLPVPWRPEDPRPIEKP
ncbi:MAG TPA: hypothetical protein VGV38_04150 [Pyrinomonadaceae bacterium]|nr:hypothetical protein [Pyrinomonadaceae bacterium]